MVLQEASKIISFIKLTWLALGEDHAALSRRVEQLTALLRSVKPWRRPLGVLAAQFLSSATRVRAVANLVSADSLGHQKTAFNSNIAVGGERKCGYFDARKAISTRETSQRSLQNESIFRLLLKVAVKGAYQCGLNNFFRGLWLQHCYISRFPQSGCSAELARYSIAGKF